MDYSKYDVNGDGFFNEADAKVAQTIYAKESVAGSALTAEEQAMYNKADFNGDGRVDAGDATSLLVKSSEANLKFNSDLDINGDGKVDDADAEVLSGIYAKRSVSNQLTAEEQAIVDSGKYDYDNDGRITAADASEHLNRIAKGVSVSAPVTGQTSSISIGTGTSSSSVSIETNVDALISKSNSFQNATARIEEIWTKIQNSLVPEIQNSWIGQDANVYTEKLLAYQPKINATCQALRLLRQTYQSAANSISQTQSELAAKANSNL